MSVIEFRGLARRLAVQKTVGTPRVEPQHPVPDDLHTNTADLRSLCPRRAVVDRSKPQQPPSLTAILRLPRQPTQPRLAEIYDNIEFVPADLAEHVRRINPCSIGDTGIAVSYERASDEEEEGLWVRHNKSANVKSRSGECEAHEKSKSRNRRRRPGQQATKSAENPLAARSNLDA